MNQLNQNGNQNSEDDSSEESVEEAELYSEQSNTKVVSHGILYFASTVFAGLFIAVAYMLQVPSQFPTRTVISVEKGQSIDTVAQRLKQEQVITSPLVFRMFVRWSSDKEKVVAGEYYFQRPRSVSTVANRLSNGEYGLVPHAVTIPEGTTSYQIAEILEDKLGESNFNKEEFLAYAVQREGYLFPDTYSFLPTTDEREIVTTMQENFERHIEEIRPKVVSQDHSIPEVVIMASLLEEEARTTRSRRVIAGILWKRIRQDMRLQVDAVFEYINGKSTFDLTYEDLGNDSPYNTYKYKGLPVGPISNPGMDSLRAAVDPIETDYLYYLSDMEGNMHYAENFEQHKENKRKYLN